MMTEVIATSSPTAASAEPLRFSFVDTLAFQGLGSQNRFRSAHFTGLLNLVVPRSVTITRLQLTMDSTDIPI